MPFLEWKDSYNIGVKEIDIQHRGLFDLVSKLSNTKHKYRDHKFFAVTLDTLMRYAELHFATEERYMLEAGYPKFEEHKKEHTGFIDAVAGLIRDLERHQPGIEQKILEFIHGWYSDHILGTDRDYLESFKAKGFK